MRRSCTLFPVEKVFGGSLIANPDVVLYIDKKNMAEILSFISNEANQMNKKKVLYILTYVLRGGYYDDFYGRENFSTQTTYLTAMKKKKGKNPRIYCKEFFNETGSGKKVVMIWPFLKKTQKIKKALRDKLTAIGGYEYDFE